MSKMCSFVQFLPSAHLYLYYILKECATITIYISLTATVLPSCVIPVQPIQLYTSSTFSVLLFFFCIFISISFVLIAVAFLLLPPPIAYPTLKILPCTIKLNITVATFLNILTKAVPTPKRIRVEKKKI